MRLGRRARWLAGTVPLLLVAVLFYGCSRAGDPSIIHGHWRAENFRLGSVRLPIAPEIDISATELAARGADVRVPIQHMEREGDEVTLTLPIGVGLVFTFDGTDRMSIDVPFVGPVYYRRAPAAATMAQARAGSPASPVSVSARLTEQAVQAARTVPKVDAVSTPATPTPPVAQAPTVPAVPMVQGEDYPALVRIVSGHLAAGDLASAAMALARAQDRHPRDPQLTYLAASLEARRGRTDSAIEQLRQAMGLGFRDVMRLQNDEALASLRSDMRYQALLALYK